jgi:beta-glucosidase-like glycosyl hydrolase
MSFPSGVALGSTFNASLITQVAYATAVEVRGNANTHGGGASW